MAIAVDVANLGTKAGDTTTTVAVTTTSAVASGGFLIAAGGAFTVNPGTTVTVSGGGLSWTTDKQVAVQTDDTFIASAQCPSGLASGTTITATFSIACSALTMGLMSFTGVKTSSPKDGSSSNASGSTTGWASSSHSLTAGSVLVAVNFNEGAITGSTTTSPSIEAWEVVNGVDFYGAVAEYRIEASAGSYTVAGTWNAAHGNGTGAVAYLASTSPPQTLRPDADIVTTGWATAPLFSKINESSADGTVITATAS